MKRIGPTMHLRTANNAPTFSRKPFHSANRLWPINGSACDQYFIHKLGKLGKESGEQGERKYNGQKKTAIWLTSEKVANCRCFESSVPITEHLTPLFQQLTIKQQVQHLDFPSFFTSQIASFTSQAIVLMARRVASNKYNSEILDFVLVDISGL